MAESTERLSRQSTRTRAKTERHTFSGRAGGAFVPQFALVTPVSLAPASCQSHGCTHCRMFAIHP